MLYEIYSVKIMVRQQRIRDRAAFTLIETVVGMAIVGILFLALYSGMASSMFSVRFAREQIRATQIMVEKMEVIRTFNWDQVNDASFRPSSFTAAYDSSDTNSFGGLVYSGRVSVVPIPVSVPQNYSDDMRLVTIALSWSSGGMHRTRSLSSYVSRYGIQNGLYY